MDLLEARGFDTSFDTTDDFPAADQVDDWHHDLRMRMVHRAEEIGALFAYGIAAKLIKVYLMVMFVCAGWHDESRVQALHPPIRPILNQALSEDGSGV